MVINENLCYLYLNLCLILLLFMGFYYDYVSADDPIQYNSVTISSFSYPETKLRPFQWRYIRVDLPPWFSSMSITLESDVNFVPGKMEKISKGMLPLICFRDGSLPLPDFSNKAVDLLDLGILSNGLVRTIEDVENAEPCYPLQKQITLKLTNEQITPGVWYVGVFNGIGAMRTQSKMINRGSSHSFTANVSVEGCMVSGFWGQFCNQSVQALSCSQSDTYYSVTNDFSAAFQNGTAEEVISCRNSIEDSCLGDNGTSVYYLDIIGLPENLTVTATDIKTNETLSFNNTIKVGQVALICYARYGAIALPNMHDYSGDLNKGALVVPVPKTGRWYITIVSVNISKAFGGVHDNMKVCYSLALQLAACPLGKAGFNCTWKRYTLQTELRKDAASPFESYYMPLDVDVLSESVKFFLEPLLRTSSIERQSGITWPSFVLDIPRGAAGANLHFKLTSHKLVTYEIYVRYGGLPSADIWDYYYIDQTNSSDGKMFFTLYNSNKDLVDFYILYAREGKWSFGLKHLNSTESMSLKQTTMSVSLERCPKSCSPPHGSCQNSVDESGLTIYSFCSCDTTHGGHDCSIELVSPQGQRWQSISLVSSNAAAILPAYWALRGKAFAEWVIFTSSGISSALYHACDVGTWCVLTFHVLQFMDFWLAFMAVVSTFVYLAAIDEASKRTIHAAVSILTALMAINGATRSANLVLVIAIGATGLLIGLIIEFSTNYRSLSFSTELCLNSIYSWNTIRTSLHNVFKLLKKRFRWGFLLAGFVALTMAAVSWTLETSESYWIWHSIWHICIYTSSFLFLCSKNKPTMVNTENQRPSSGNYELTRQNSTSNDVE